MRRSIQAIAAGVLGGLVVLAGCHVDEHKDGDNKDVNIRTPFGGMQVKTDDRAVPEEIGLPLYPGATLSKRDDNHGSADVNLSFGSLRMRVKAATYQTSDDPGKVEAFYRDGLKRYGDVIACRGNHPVGTPVKTAEGLTCEEEGKHVSVEDSWKKGTLELKAGSREHQHIVAIDPNQGGTKLGLVALDLPAMLVDGGSSGDDRQ